jgi:Ca-activated chloride channel family protein
MVQPNGPVTGVCPLTHTDVQADIAGFVGRTRVKQTFTNPLDRKIEAIYVFPLPQDAAVDEMVMVVGGRRIVGQIKPRGEAREIYERAKAAGHVTGLLDQERPNIFTQSLANIEPGVQIDIEISYVETLKYEDGQFEFVFPMVVGPRYMPGTPSGQQGSGWSPDTSEVPDASKISPRPALPGFRAGHDISVKVNIDAGLPLVDVKSELHEVLVNELCPGRVTVSLKNEVEIPNKDFILRYRTATDQIGDAVLTHSDARGSFVTLILQPPQRAAAAQIMPREVVFVLDTSGSMSGFPIEKAKAVMAKAIDALRPGDTFNLITFSGDTRILWDKPRPSTSENRKAAQEFLASRSGGGGTEMMEAINAALIQTAPAPGSGVAPIRVVCFMTDGYVGNDFEIIDAIKKNAATTRVFAFGIGNSVNRFLLDGMAQAGRGEVEYVTLASQSDTAVERFRQRIDAPLLTDITVDWGGLPALEAYPRAIPDLFSAKPLMLHARLATVPEGTITLRGRTPAGDFERQIKLEPSEAQNAHEALALLWARSKVADLIAHDMTGLQRGTLSPELREAITSLGVEYRLMTQFTSFVAVEEMRITVGGELTTISVPVEMPEGVSYESVFGQAGTTIMALKSAPAKYTFSGPRGGGGGGPGAAAGGVAPPAQLQRAAREEPAEPPPSRHGSVDALNGLDESVPRAATPEPVLAEPLRALASKVESEGKDGDLTVGKVRVSKYRVDVMIYLADTADETLKALKDLGFEQTGESKAVRLVIGTIDVRKLEELAKIKSVVRVEPVAK